MRRIRSVIAILCLSVMLPGAPARSADVRIEHGTASTLDGITIDYTFAHPDGLTPRPVILLGHGWGLSRVTDFSGGIGKTFVDAGYAVLTWDARGFGTSGGEANVDSQDYEVRDVQTLISMLAERTDVVLDAPNDPRIGMYGESYAGGIQLMTAAADARIDAIAPQIAWNDLPQALKPGGVLKLGWDLALYGLGVGTGTALGAPNRQTGSVAPQLHQAVAEGVALNDWSAGTLQWFDERSPKHYLNGAQLGSRTLPGIGAPALIIQGVSDTLFSLNHGIANFDAIRARDVPAKLLAFCGGHTIAPLGSSCVPGNASAKITSSVLAWFDRYVKGNAGTDTGPAIEYQLQDGTWESVDALPQTGVTASGSTRLTNTIAPTSGQLFAGTAGGCRPAVSGESATAYARDCPYAAGEWIEVGRFAEAVDTPSCLVFGEPKPPDSGGIGPDAPLPPCPLEALHLPIGTRLLGSPTVDLTLSGTGVEGYLFFKLVDYDTVTKTKTVIDDQVSALKVSWPPSGFATRDLRVRLAAVSWLVRKDHHIFLEITPTSNDHASSRTPFALTLSPVQVTVPTIEPAAPAAPTIDTPLEGAVFTAAGTTTTVTVTGTAEPGAVVRVQRRGVREAKVTANAVTGVWTASIRVKTDATHPITATQQNAAGAVSEKSATRTFEVVRA